MSTAGLCSAEGRRLHERQVSTQLSPVLGSKISLKRLWVLLTLGAGSTGPGLGLGLSRLIFLECFNEVKAAGSLLCVQ